MILIDKFGRAAAGLALACALPLASCMTMTALPSGRCARWRIVLEPRLTAGMGLDGELKPLASVTARPVCAKPAIAS